MEILRKHFEGLRDIILDSGFGLLAVNSEPGFRSILVEILTIGDCSCTCVVSQKNFPPGLRHRNFPAKLTVFNSIKGVLMNVMRKAKLDEKSGQIFVTIRIVQVSTYTKKSGKIRIYN